MEDFIKIEEMSENGKLIQNILSRINEKYPSKIPRPYAKLVVAVSTPSAVAGFLQPNSPDPLNFLEEFCQLNQINQTSNFRTPENIEKFKILSAELPALWPILVSICEFEKVNKFPTDVAVLVTKLVSIKKNTFLNASQRIMFIVLILKQKNPHNSTPPLRKSSTQKSTKFLVQLMKISASKTFLIMMNFVTEYSGKSSIKK